MCCVPFAKGMLGKKVRNLSRLKLKLLCKLIHTNTASQVAQDELLPVTVKTNGFAEIAEAICERALPLKQTMPLDKTPVQTHFQI